jgi:hypothetical protein
MKPRATLVTFATGQVFERYAAALLESAQPWFFPGRAEYLVLEGATRFPYSIRDRHSYILRARRRIRGEFVFFLDADMLFCGPVDDEIIGDGVSAVVHPCINDWEDFTYERDPTSAAYIPYGEGRSYYLGGVLGAPRATFLEFSAAVDELCRQDGDRCPVWQDESYVNRLLLDTPPAVELDERYASWWSRPVADPRIRALDKTPAEFRWRDSQH